MDCPYIPSSSYAEFSQRLHDKVASERIPISGSLEVTARCNLRCGHCYINLPAGDALARERELTAQELYGILDQITDEGCLWLLLTGGEPFLRPDFLDVYMYAKQKGLLLTVFTNGTTITPRIADHLATWPPFSVEITLYGYSQETYEQVTGVAGSHQRCMQAIELLLERSVPLKLKSTPTRVNHHEIQAMQAYADALGVAFRFDPILNMRLDGDPTPGRFRLSPHEVVALDRQDERRAQAWCEEFDRSRGLVTPSNTLYTCGAGMSSFHIDAYGQLSICLMAREPGYGLREGSFHDGWHHALYQVRMQPRTRTMPCQSCALARLCPQCPGLACIETNDPEQPVGYFCEITHLRAAAFGECAGAETRRLASEPEVCNNAIIT